ncbi:MAG: exodeoxyribonuclease VII small subunit [Clostridia bacterium]|nr:exodeoxyribonuclease VII small subunit [Clostridia bacterium]
MENKELNFEQSLERLEEITKLLEAEKTPLDESLKLYEEGITLVRACRAYLEQAEQRIKVIKDGDSATSTGV